VFVVSGDGGKVVTSADGTSWKPHDSHTRETLIEAAYANGKFVAVGTGGAIVTSPDGNTWTLIDPVPPVAQH
jgi:hypothetical protein